MSLWGRNREEEDTDRPEAEDPAASLELVYALMATEDPMFAQQMLGGECSAQIDWWVFVKKVSLDGRGLIGVYRDHSGNAAFTIRAQGQKDGKLAGFNVTWTKQHSLTVDTKYY